MLTAAKRIATARRHGIVNPIIAWQEAQRAGIPYAVLCAVLEQETAGGRNVFGHDPTIFAGAGKVTKAKYLAYKRRRGSHGQGGMQGVGPMQLTYWSYQDQADREGGSWNPRSNIRVGAQILRDHYRSSGSWYRTFVAYNGSHSYGVEVGRKLARWERRFSGQNNT